MYVLLEVMTLEPRWFKISARKRKKDENLFHRLLDQGGRMKKY